MVKNNSLALIYYVLITIIVYILFGGIMTLFQNLSTPKELVLLIPLSILTLVSFILVGRFLLKNTGSTWKNGSSVVLPFIIGLCCAFSVIGTPDGQINFLEMYYAYSAPFGVSISFFNPAISDTSLLYGVIFSLIPSVFYFAGLQWQSRIRKSVLRY